MATPILFLISLVLAGSSALIAAPSLADNVIQDEQISATDTTVKSKDSNPASSAANSASNSTNGDQVVVAKTGSKVSDSGSSVAGIASNPNPRVPLYSRIFAVPSMQQ